MFAAPPVPPSRLREAHPALFQRPGWDKAVAADPQLRHTADPNRIWIPSERAERSVPPVFPSPELARLMALYRPTVRPPHEREAPSLLYNVFYSAPNIRYVQKAIAAQVYQTAQLRTPLQTATDLMVLMGNVFREHARHVNEETVPLPTVVALVREEVRRLNALVVNVAVPTVIANAESMGATAARILAGPQQLLPRPVAASIRGAVEHRPIERVLAG